YFQLFYTEDNGCANTDINTSDDWGCRLYNKRKNLALTGWKETSPLQTKRMIAQHVHTKTVLKVPPTCRITVKGDFFNNYICSAEDFAGEIKKIQNDLSKFNKNDTGTHISREAYNRFNTNMELLEYCNSGTFAEIPKQIKDQLAAFQRLEKHDAIQLKKEESCGDMDLRKEKVNGKNRIPPIRDQDSLGWCYAYAGADFIGYYLGEDLSALAISVKNYQGELLDGNLRLTQLRDGNLSMVLDALKVDGNLCTENQVNSEDIAFVQNQESRLKRTLQKIESFFNEENRDEVSFVCSIEEDFKELFPQLDLWDFLDVLKKSNDSTVFIELINKACGNKKNQKFLEDFSIEYNAEPTVEDIHRLLENKELPAISFDASLIVDNISRGAHVVTVVGRRYNKEEKRCEFLLRNSWGEYCYPQYNYPCEGGNLWIPERELVRNIKGVYQKK
ncbi:MAG: hypothetical protein OXB84_01415, partial [Halobacteriovoraceae bacterium]|nr:hypothetical protein [Halobacteriovoraceae bacterium]